jgi:formylglycine-generating enzyme required for sulfatase activity
MTVACPLPAPSIWLLAKTRPAIQRTAPPLHSKSPQPIISVRRSSFRCRIPVGLLRVRRLSLAMAFTGLQTPQADMAKASLPVLSSPFLAPLHTYLLKSPPNYYLAKTPVTNAQYAAFVQAVGWQAIGSKWTGDWAEGKSPPGKADHPVNDVTWDEAMAYCRWLSDVTGRAYSLPSEAEWEKGARGTDGRIYPWGKQWGAARCNANRGDQGDTTPVDVYPQGASPYGVLDMAGNVWEWTRSLWGTNVTQTDFKYPYNLGDGRENRQASGRTLRVRRGGAFGNLPWNVRCAYRNRRYPDFSSRDLGFRVVMHP